MSFNMKSGIRWIALGAIVLGSSGCSVFTVPEGPWRAIWGNPEHGDRVDVVMTGEVVDGMSPLARCDHSGGTLVARPLMVATDTGNDVQTGWTLVCEGVDF